MFPFSLYTLGRRCILFNLKKQKFGFYRQRSVFGFEMSDHFSTYKDIFKLVSRANDDIEVFETIFREYANSGALIKTTGLASAALHLAKLSISR